MSTPKIKLTNNTAYVVDRNVFDRLMTALNLHENQLQGKEISICLVDNKEMRFLNRRYFGKDSPTNVLTFENSFPEEPTLGEIIINIERVMQENKTDMNTELKKLVIHGTLHLLGYDHINTEEEKKMAERENELLKMFRIKEENDG